MLLRCHIRWLARLLDISGWPKVSARSLIKTQIHGRFCRFKMVDDDHIFLTTALREQPELAKNAILDAVKLNLEQAGFKCRKGVLSVFGRGSTNYEFVTSVVFNDNCPIVKCTYGTVARPGPRTYITSDKPISDPGFDADGFVARIIEAVKAVLVLGEEWEKDEERSVNKASYPTEKPSTEKP